MKSLAALALLFGNISASSEVDTLIEIQDEKFTNDSKYENIIELDAPKTDKHITCYFENWNKPSNPGPGTDADASYYANDAKHCTHWIYAFITLAQRVYDPPKDLYWDGLHLYESMA